MTLFLDILYSDQSSGTLGLFSFFQKISSHNNHFAYFTSKLNRLGIPFYSFLFNWCKLVKDIRKIYPHVINIYNIIKCCITWCLIE